MDVFLETLSLLVKKLDGLQLNEVDALINNLQVIIRPAVVRRIEREAAIPEVQIGPNCLRQPAADGTAGGGAALDLGHGK